MNPHVTRSKAQSEPSSRRIIRDFSFRNMPNDQPMKPHCRNSSDDDSTVTSASSLFSESTGRSMSSGLICLKSFDHHAHIDNFRGGVRHTLVSRRQKRKVYFGTVEVRKYALILGDNPGASYPLALDWPHSKSRIMRIDDFDVVRTSRAKQLNADERIERLRHMGYAKADLRSMERDRKMGLLKEWENVPINEYEDHSVMPPPCFPAHTLRDASKF